MEKQSGKKHKGFVLLETLLAFGIISFAVLFFYQGELGFLLDIENKMIDSRMHRVLYEEVVEARRIQQKTGLVNIERNGYYEVSYRLEELPYAQISSEKKQFGIYRK